MRIQLTTDRACAMFCDHAGDVIDVPELEAVALARSGQGVIVETAMTEPANERRTNFSKRNKQHASRSSQ